MIIEREIPIYENLHDLPADGSVFLALFRPKHGIWADAGGGWLVQELYLYKGGTSGGRGYAKVFTDAKRTENKLVMEEIPAGWSRIH